MNSGIHLNHLLMIIVVHWVADFVFQTRAVATNKGKSLKVLTEHVSTYTMVTLVLYALLMWVDTRDMLYNLLFFSLANYALHWVTDFTTSKASGYFYGRGNLYGFFTVIGFDQVVHYSSLVCTFAYFLS
jgi:amino acid transporter